MKTKKLVSQLPSLILLSLIFLLTFMPFILMVVSSLKYQMQIIENPWFFSLPIHFENYAAAFSGISWSIVNSIIITIMGIIMVIIMGSMASYAFARYEFPLKNILYLICLLMLMVPGFIMLIPQFVQINGLGMYNTYLGLSIPPAVHNCAMAVLLMTSYIRGLPNSLFEAARIEGANEFMVFTRIAIPMSKPIISVNAILTGIAIWNNYVWSLICTDGEKVRPVIVALTTLTAGVNNRTGVQLAGCIIASIPLLILFSFSSKYFIAGLAAGGVKG